MSYRGDYAPASSVVFNFNTASFSDGSPITLAGTPALSVYKNSTTESTSGVTLTVDYDSRTGMHHVVIDTSADGTFYAAGNDFSVVITAGTVGGTSVVGRVVGAFSLNNRSALRPATAGRQLVVDAAGLADACAVKVGPSGSGTAQTAGDIPARLPAALTAGGNMKSDPLAINGVSTSSVTTVKPVIGLTTADTISALANNTITAASLAADAGAEIADAVWDEALSGHSTTGSAGVALSTTYANVISPTDFAGGILLEIQDTIGTPSDFGTGATLAANNVDTFASLGNVTDIATNIFTGLDTVAATTAGIATTIGVAGAGLTAITAKTNLIPASPAAVGSLMGLADGAITDAKITAPAEAAGRPTGILAMIRRAFEWGSNKRIRTRSTGAVQLRNAADSADLETQTQSTSGSVGSEIDSQSKGI